MKCCFRCGVMKPAEEFYRHPAMADGRLGKCKDCTRADVTLHRKRNIERIRKYDRSRATLPHRIAKTIETTRSWRQRHPERNPAQTQVHRAVRTGAIAKPALCQHCKRRTRVEAHHPDYTKPLAVQWLCKPCHVVADRKRREETPCPAQSQ